MRLTRSFFASSESARRSLNLAGLMVGTATRPTERLVGITSALLLASALLEQRSNS